MTLALLYNHLNNLLSKGVHPDTPVEIADGVDHTVFDTHRPFNSVSHVNYAYVHKNVVILGNQDPLLLEPVEQNEKDDGQF